jgi:hypothetical protein
MSCNNVQILNFNHNIVEVGSDNKLIITDNVKCNSITIPQPVTNILQINSPGPQGQTGAAGAIPNTGSFVTTSSFNAYTGSNTSQFSGTSSFALTASYALNAGTTIDTGSFVTTSSFNAFTQSINTATSSFVLNSQTSSFVTNNQTSSFVQNSQTSSFVTTSSFNTFTASYNTFTSSYNTGSFSGSLVGTASWAESASVAISSSYAATASYVVTALTASYVTASAIVGTVLSSSYAATASYAQTLTLQSTLTTFTSSITVAGVNILFTQATSSYNSAFGKYTVLSGSNARAGEFMTVWNSRSITYTDVSTTDIGSTANITFSSSFSGNNILLQATASAGWTIKMLTTFI